MYDFSIFRLNRENKFEIMRVNNQVRDSHLDLPADQVNSFYEAMRALGDILEANCYGFKMEDGKLSHPLSGHLGEVLC